MQRVVNCIYQRGDEVLLLQKPKRGWWVAPGGKVEIGETLQTACIREFEEETGIRIINPELRAAFTMNVIDEKNEDEWMLFTFYCNEGDGQLLSHSDEGKVEWVKLSEIKQLPMAEGDRQLLVKIVSDHQKHVFTGKFTYTSDWMLMSTQFDS